jgi:NAD(P)-dependent dehydrogenase (short-subunit alcohol dehydrogenase family)
MSSTANYEGKVAVVTGAASGIGLATVRRLLDGGAKVVGGDLNEETLNDVAKELGDGFTPVVGDVSSESDIEELVATATSEHGRLDAGFNVAGIGDVAPIVEMTEELWDRVLSVNLKGVFFAIKHEARAMLEGGGAIVSVASINSFQPAAGIAAYSTAKAGVEMLTRQAAIELGEHGIRVNAISPGIVSTPLTTFMTETPTIRDAYLGTIPMGRLGDPDDIAAAATFLASDDAGWVSGANLVVDGAESLTGYPNLLKLVSEVPAEVSHAE